MIKKIVNSADDLINRALRRRSLPQPSVRRRIREQTRLRQQDVAAVLRVDRATLSRWESGETSPRGPMFDAYLDLLERLKAEVLA